MNQTPDKQLPWRMLIVGLLAGAVVLVTVQQSINPFRAGVLGARGLRYAQSGDFNRGMEDFQRADSLSPQSTIYSVIQGNVYIGYLRNPDVISDPECKFLTEGVPSYRECLAGQAYLSFERAEHERPYAWRQKLNLAEIALVMGRTDEAMELGAEVVALVPNSWPLLNRVAAIYIKAGRTDLALPLLAKSQTLSPGRVETQRLIVAAQKLQE